MALKPLPHATRDYIAAFDLSAVAGYRDGRIGVTRDPAGAELAWWCESVLTGKLIRQVQRDGGDISVIARTLAIPISAHATVLARAGLPPPSSRPR
jgi:hypothetical protein